MYEKSCASSNHIKSWKDIDFGTAEYEVKKLQMRIAKAVKENRVGKIKSLQWTLTHSFYAKAIAVKRVTENKGKRTPGVDGVCWISNEDKFNAIFTLQRRGYQPQPLRRIYIPKKNGKKRPLSIPTMKDRAMQTLHKMALEPVTETLADGTSYGFRPNRCVQDAIEQCFVDLARKTAPEWVLEGDIKGCFDNWRDRFEKSINQKTERKLSVYFELYEGAWIPADSPGIWKTDRSKINIICFFQNQAVGAKWIYPQNPGIAKSNRDFIVRCRHEQSICRCSGRVPERRTAGSHIFYMGGWKKI